MAKISHAHYQRTHYWSDLRVRGYSNQLIELYHLDPDSVLEIGIADGFMKSVVPKFTRHRLITLDPNSGLEPDVVGSVLDLPFRTDSFDMVMCCQVLEHIPYASFVPALTELRRVTRRTILLSLPDVRRYFSLRVRLPKWGWREASLSLERRHLGPFEFDGDHHWEIGFEGTRYADIVRALQGTGAKIERQYRIPELPYHCCFVLDPAK